MTDITFFTYAMGLSSLLVVLTGLITASLLAIRYFETRNPAVLTVICVILSMGLTWSGTAISFFLVLAGEEPLDATAYGLITITPLSFIGPFLVLSTMQMLRMMRKMSVLLVIMIILGSLSLFVTYTDTESIYDEYKIHEESGLGEGSYKGIVRITMAAYILFAVFFITPLYIYVGVKTDSSKVRMKTALLALGYGLFGTFGAMDGLLTLDAITVIIVRAGLASALLSIYLGYTLPPWLERWLKIIENKILREEQPA
ncbi:MAG: hypothetical protein ACFFB3_23175 [Candidatus Hodarchaeota archaeon]